MERTILTKHASKIDASINVCESAAAAPAPEPAAPAPPAPPAAAAAAAAHRITHQVSYNTTAVVLV